MASIRPSNNNDLDQLLDCLLVETEINRKEQVLTDVLKIYSASRDDYHLRFSVWQCLAQIKNYQLLTNLIIQDIQRVSANQWLFMRGVDHLIAMEQIQDACHLFINCQFKTRLIEPIRLYKQISTLVTKIGKQEGLRWLNSFPKDSPLNELILAKKGQLYFLSKKYPAALSSFRLIDDKSIIPQSSLSLWAQAAVFSSGQQRQNDIERILCFAANKMSPGLVHYLLIAIVVHGNLELAWKIFDSLDEYLLSQWEVLLWINRIPLPKALEISLSQTISRVYQENIDLDVRWKFQYTLLNIRHNQYTDATTILREVGEVHPSLAHLSVPLSMACASERVEAVPAIQPDRLSPVSLIEHPEAQATCVVFAGWSGALGYFSENYLAQCFEEYAINLLILQDPSMKWFASGLKSFGSSIEETSSSLRDAYSHLFRKPTICLGSSVSGLAALHYSVPLKAQAVMSFAGIRSASDFKVSITEVDIEASGHKAMVRLEKLKCMYGSSKTVLEAIDSTNIRLHYVYGEENTKDKATFDFYSQYANIEEHVIRGVDTHSIANHCIGHNLLPQIMNRVIAQL